MTTPRVLLKAWNLRSRYRLGQNFLSDPAVAKSIVARAGITKQESVLEIGPGLGALTIPLARQAGQIKAVEKDTRLIKLLRAELLSHNITNTEVIPGDFLQLSIEELLSADRGPWVVAGNLPYNISSQVLVRLIESRVGITRALLMFQTELAQRMTALPGGRQYGRLSAMLQYCGDIKTIAHVDAARFYPRPKVHSQVLEIRFDHQRRLPPDEEKFLFRVIKAAFGQRRKTLKNALSAGNLNLDREGTVHALTEAGVTPNRRAETLSVAEFLALSRNIFTQTR
jgi:16S rRNA (adenine1518-N6/adenine1519-N6)-dimethyltransferase